MRDPISETVVGEVEKDSFITLPEKGLHWVCQNLCGSYSGEDSEKLYVMVQRGHDWACGHYSDGLVVR